jgi:hypothetical protein
VKVSPATFNKKKCAVTPGWEWVQGKGCRKVKGAKTSPSPGAVQTKVKKGKSKSKSKAKGKSKSKQDAKSPSTFNKTKCQVTSGWQWVQGVGCRKVRDYNRPKNKKKEGEAGEEEEAGEGDGEEEEVEEDKKSATCPKLSPSAFNEATCKATPGWQWIEGVGCRKLRNYKGSPNAVNPPASTGAAPEVAAALQDTAKALQSMMPAIQKLTAVATKPPSCVGGVCPM